ncbi:poly(hydroxyalkanoate) depolymerase family esterase [Rhizobium subbaraonis]|uniref:Poly(Hydroxyalkanoate) depolymerase family esterase n=1 Tax=Rhizobium subbaraonis TaxID=908946 RepID=A0A285UE73_9HYPH|nr:PHB depolymerase family esterase [Rhizobium subbaraonis]SOC39967.1 poly(hydroxyalkanoate) depolymerase family esterase [Rhizobium subbaraonis]
MRDRFKRSMMDRLFFNPERFGELFRPFFTDLEADHRAAGVRRRRGDGPGLSEARGFGSNPGNLRMFEYVPEALPAEAPLVVVLHGCRQTAESYDRAAGWASLAHEQGFCVLYPEQKDANNPRRCFNWFRPSEVTRDRGELASIRQMIDHLSTRAGCDPARIYITGLSAGGAMTAAMLANYPELFAGGAIFAGLPFGAARDARRALAAMERVPGRDAREWGELVRAAAPAQGRLPPVSIWHGTADRTVSISNAEALVDQWLDVHGLEPGSFSESRAKGRRIRRWRDATGRSRVTYHRIAGLGHGTPVARGKGGGYATRPEPFMLEAGFSSTLEIAREWGLLRRR